MRISRTSQSGIIRLAQQQCVIHRIRVKKNTTEGPRAQKLYTSKSEVLRNLLIHSIRNSII